MFSKILKWTARLVLGLIVVVLIAFGIFSFLFHQHTNKTYAVTVRDIPVPDDSATIAAGRHLYEIKGCGECHGADLRGKVFVDDPPIGRIAGSNLTYGKGGLPASYDNKAWLKALRHGLNAENKTLLLMPSEEFTRLDDHDIAAIIAYCKAQPKIDTPSVSIKIGPMGKVLSVLGKIPLFPAEHIDHQREQPNLVVKASTKEYGQYLSVSCTGCHKPSLTGGDNPVPGGVPVANITSTGHVGKWSQEEFIATLRTGKTPEGKQLQAKDMPWPMTAQYTEEELTALYLYLKSI
ncbi:c-type cytochrome [Chitinophaga arvensicola]|uniref:Cytochrome c553 n=1 Tax=Chitinophaga arvensicola TaxID=29529 RepID=A0A1I0ND92_9BACT|nr:cytochrome c [Chitinophaga arvensicola]SEV98646.1 Cytochrome c553 [Chitinophaga arvensicola]